MFNLEELLARNPSTEELAQLTEEQLEALYQQVRQTQGELRQTRQIYFYEPVSSEARKVHFSQAKEIVIVGGNRSSKTDTALVDAAICMTGMVPRALPDFPKEKIQCPMRVRVVCESLTNTWEPVIKPKLQWNRWNGRGEPGGQFGHWGWIPREFLLKGDWSNSWSEKNRTLTLTCGCTLSVMSYDQDLEDFFGGSFHRVIHDEGPPEDIYRENKMRTMDTGGQLWTAFTPPDDESTAWRAAWVYDDLYEKGLSGPGKDRDIDAFTLFTENNRILDRDSIALISKGLTPAQREVRLRGAFIHLSGRIYPHYTDKPKTWCFSCNEPVLNIEGRCTACGNQNLVDFCHYIEPVDIAYSWPCIFAIDPHPRKPHAMAWFAVSPSDDIFEVAELEVDNTPEEVKKEVDLLERTLGLKVQKRIMDPNMAESPSGTTNKRGRTVRDEFDAVGLRCDLADDNRETARSRLRLFLKPDQRTRTPRFHIFQTCPRSNYMLLRYVWAEYTRSASQNRDQKQIPADKNDDFPALAQYVMNSNPSFSALNYGTRRVAREGRRGAY